MGTYTQGMQIIRQVTIIKQYKSSSGPLVEKDIGPLVMAAEHF